MIQPSWLTTYDSEYLTYGFDSTGLWFAGDAGDGDEDDLAIYPVRTNFDIPETTETTVIFRFIYDAGCDDHGICLFNTDTVPLWSWDPDDSRIAFSIDCGGPVLIGQAGQVGFSVALDLGKTYTGVLIYNPDEGTVTGEIYEGTSITVAPLETQILEESLPSGPYRVGFAADHDTEEDDPDDGSSYFTYISVNGRTTDGSVSCDSVCVDEIGIKCRMSSDCTCAKWKYMKNGYVPAITVCNQELT